MRLLIVGTLEGQIGAASQIAIQRGARVEQVDTTDAGLAALRIGQGADLVMIDVTLDVGGFIKSLKSERISLPVVACGIGNDTKAAVRAIRAQSLALGLCASIGAGSASYLLLHWLSPVLLLSRWLSKSVNSGKTYSLFRAVSVRA